MPSWQARITTFLLKRRVKNRVATGISVDSIRRAVARPVLPKPPHGWVAQSGRLTPDLAGEWILRAGQPAAPAPGGMILYLHGGGYFFCSPQTHRRITQTLAAGSGLPCFALDYRLAPEHPFPAAVQDAMAAYRALLAGGVPAERIVIAGDSAGGGLTLATAIALRDAGAALPAGLLCLSPWTDLAITGDSVTRNAERCAMFTAEGLRRGAPIYHQNTPATNPLVSPLYADLSGLPPLFIQVSNSELLLDDSTRLAERARAAGVSVNLTIWPDLPHVWQIFTPFLPEARQALAAAAGFIRRQIVAP